MLARLLPLTSLFSLLVAFAFELPCLAEIEWQSSRYSSRPYVSSFDLPSVEEYEGDTAFVRYVPPPEEVGKWSGGLSGVILTSNFYPTVPPPVIRQRPPIELTDIAAIHSTTTYATVAESLNDVGTAQSFGHSNESSEELANYAHVRSETAPHSPLLAFSQAFAEQTFEADDFQFEASGRVHSNADILQVLTGNATSATSSGETYFMTEYHLTQAHDFIMDIELSTNESDAEFSFQLHDLTTDEMVLYWSGARGDRMRYEHCGTLLPGTYKMIIETQSDAGVATQAIPDLGGFGEFDVYFRALNPHGEIIPVLHPSERRKPGVRYSDEVGNSALIPGDSFELFHAENGMFVASVPEPSPTTLLCVGMLVAFGGLEAGQSRRSRCRL